MMEHISLTKVLVSSKNLFVQITLVKVGCNGLEKSMALLICLLQSQIESTSSQFIPLACILDSACPGCSLFRCH